MQGGTAGAQRKTAKNRTAWKWLGALALCGVLTALAGWQYWQHEKSSAADLPAQQVDRLRMLALAGQDAQALPVLRRAAESGNVAAQRALAEVFLRRRETAQEGVQYAENAARNGDTMAQFMLGKAYFDGMATATHLPDMARARHWLELAAEHQNAAAMYLLGLMHKGGYGGSVDFPLAARWFARAVQAGNADAMFMLGNAYHAGEGVAQDEAQALRLYQAAAEKEHPLATQTLALAYRDGALGLKQDKKEAEQMMREVAHILSHPEHQ